MSALGGAASEPGWAVAAVRTAGRVAALGSAGALAAFSPWLDVHRALGISWHRIMAEFRDDP